MSAVLQVTKTGPRTYTPAEQILGGQVVEARAAGRVGVAAANSVKVLGVALVDAATPESVTGLPTLTNGRQVLNAGALPTRVAVAYGGDEVPVTYSAAVAFGDLLVATAGGQVGPYVAAAAAAVDVANTIIGRCTAPAGVAAGAVGLMRIA